MSLSNLSVLSPNVVQFHTANCPQKSIKTAAKILAITRVTPRD